MIIDTLAIVGVGLIGGSIGLAAKARHLARRVVGVGRRQAGLEEACRLNAIDEGFLDLASAVAAADLVVVCSPVDQIAAHVLEVASRAPKGCLITDAGSTKAAIVQRVDQEIGEHIHFVGSHPLAGSEKKGVRHARADLFQDRLVVVTPTPQSDAAAVERTIAFWSALGARVQRLSPANHDRALARTSHLPHLVAAALAGILPKELYDFAASGFRDTTRIAAGDPELWSAIFRENREFVLDAVSQFERRLAGIVAAIRDGNSERLTAFLQEARKVRDDLGS